MEDNKNTFYNWVKNNYIETDAGYINKNTDKTKIYTRIELIAKYFWMNSEISPKILKLIKNEK